MIAPTLPSLEQLRPSLDKLQSETGSVVLIAISWPRSKDSQECQNYPDVQTAWLSKDETDALRTSLTKAKAKRKLTQNPQP